MQVLFSECHSHWKERHFYRSNCLGIFLYGWDKFNKWFHWFCGFLVGISGLASGILVVAANAWMNSPAGFDYVNGQYINIDPIAAMFNDAWFPQAFHMTVAAFCATGFAVAGVHAYLITKRKMLPFIPRLSELLLGLPLSALLVRRLVVILRLNLLQKDNL